MSVGLKSYSLSIVRGALCTSELRCVNNTQLNHLHYLHYLHYTFTTFTVKTSRSEP